MTGPKKSGRSVRCEFCRSDYDNLKSAVLERQGTTIRFNPTLLLLARHYGFEPRPVAVARGNEKGRVERAIRNIRDAYFFAGCTFNDLDDLNAQADAWVIGPAGERRCTEDESLTVDEAFAHERERLLALPGNAFPTEEVKAKSAGKTPYVRFDLNDYLIPHTCVARTLTVVATLNQVRILDGQTVIAIHPRSYDRRQHIEIPEHIATLTLHKHQAGAHRGTDWLSRRFVISSGNRTSVWCAERSIVRKIPITGLYWHDVSADTDEKPAKK